MRFWQTVVLAHGLNGDDGPATTSVTYDRIGRVVSRRCFVRWDVARRRVPGGDAPRKPPQGSTPTPIGVTTSGHPVEAVGLLASTVAVNALVCLA